jgi:hypothetical protein
VIPRKLVEAAFRSWWVLLLPVVLLPALVLALVDHPVEYRSSAQVTVSAPEGIDPGPLGQNRNPWRTPAQNQAEVLNDLMGSRAFREPIAVDAGLVSPESSPELIERAGRIAAERLTIGATGVTIVGITATGPTAESALALADAFVNRVQSYVFAEASRGNSRVIEYYERQISEATEELGVRQAELNAYAAANPTAATQRPPDLTYERLVTRVTNQVRVLDGYRDQLAYVSAQQAAAPEALNAVFSVLDTPNLPAQPAEITIAQRVGLPAAGLLLGLLISAAYLWVAYRTDHAIRSSEDIAQLGVPVLGAIPVLRERPTWWRGYRPVTLLPPRRARNYARQVAAAMVTLSVKGGS